MCRKKLKTYAGKETLVITTELLKTAGLLGKNFTGEVKILGDGEITFPVSVAGKITVSKAQRKRSRKRRKSGDTSIRMMNKIRNLKLLHLLDHSTISILDQ